MKSTRSLIIIVAVLMSTVGIAQDYLPQAKVVNDKGESIDIQDYVKSGGPKIVSLWATWCGPCRMELNALKKVAPRWRDEYGVEIVAVSVDIPQMVNRARKMFESNSWDYTFLHDANQELMGKLGIQGIPYSMLIDEEGKIQSVQMGYSPAYEKQLEKKLKAL